MMTGKYIYSKDILAEIKELRKDLQGLTNLLIGASDEPDKPGLVERIRILEASQRLVKWLVGAAVLIVLADGVTRAISLYRGIP
jgi:hypothetical protein